MGSPSQTSNLDDSLPSWRRHLYIKNILSLYSTDNPVSAIAYPTGRRPRPELWDICHGCVLWLLKKEDLDGKLVEGSVLSLKDPKFFNHPVLVLDVQISGASAAIIKFATMTSLTRRPLHRVPFAVRDRHIPVYPSNPHPKSRELLHLEKEHPTSDMTNPSYVCLDTVYELDWTAFQCYSQWQRGDAFRQRLTKASFDLVVARMGLLPGSWINTERLCENYIEQFIPGGVEMLSGKLQGDGKEKTELPDQPNL